MDYPNYEITVVDNGSTDGSQTMVRDIFPRVHLITNNTNVGVAEGQIIGIRYAVDDGAEYILITNNDVTFDKKCLTELVTAAKSDNKIGIVGPKNIIQRYPIKFGKQGVT
jgi:GT2 family glycosyltransferase